MDIAALLLEGILPTVLAIAAVVSSVMVACRARHILHFVISAVVLAGVAWSLLILYRIFVLGAWPTYLPHFVIGILLFVVVAQIFLYRSRRHDVAS